MLPVVAETRGRYVDSMTVRCWTWQLTDVEVCLLSDRYRRDHGRPANTAVFQGPLPAPGCRG